MNKKLILTSLLVIILISSIASAATVSHKAEQIKPGVFGLNYTGNWIFINGLFGIGTTTPNKNLTVAGDANITGLLYSQNQLVCLASGANCNIIYSDLLSVGNWSADKGSYNTTSQLSTLYYNKTSNVDLGSYNLTTTGRIGIGTTTPNQALQVVGNANVSGTVYASNISSNSPLQIQTKGVTRIFVNDSNGNVGIGTITPTTKLDVKGNVSLNNTLYVLENGNVGIGTTNPVAKLSVGSGNQIQLIDNPVGYPNYGQIPNIVLNDTYDNPLSNSGWTYPQLSFVQKNGGTVWSQGWSFGGLRFIVNGKDALFLRNDSNVGIGTITPNQKLTVEGNLNVTGDIYANSSSLYLGTKKLTNENGVLKWGGTEVGASVGSTPQIGSPNTRIPLNNTITVVDSTDDVGAGASLTTGFDGLPVISYLDATNNYLKVLKCGNEACSSGNMITNIAPALVISGVEIYQTSIAISTDGNPVISYPGATDGNLSVVKCGNAACSSGNTITSINTYYAGNGAYSSIAIGAAGNPMISFSNHLLVGGYFKGYLMAFECTNAACTSGNFHFLSDNSIRARSTSIAIGIDNFPVVAYTTTAYFGVSKCNDTSCSGYSITNLELNPQQYATISIGDDGFPLILYTDSGGKLRLLKCGNQACSSGNTNITLATLSSDNTISSFTIGTDGLPLIAYPSSDKLNAMKCFNANCSNNLTITLDDDAWLILKYSLSVAIGADGLPMFAYYDSTAGNLKVLKCGSSNCRPFWTRR